MLNELFDFLIFAGHVRTGLMAACWACVALLAFALVIHLHAEYDWF